MKSLELLITLISCVFITQSSFKSS